MATGARSINVHLGVELKLRWISHCSSLGKTSGAALKEAIEHQLENISTVHLPKS